MHTAPFWLFINTHSSSSFIWSYSSLMYPKLKLGMFFNPFWAACRDFKGIVNRKWFIRVFFNCKLVSSEWQLSVLYQLKIHQPTIKQFFIFILKIDTSSILCKRTLYVRNNISKSRQPDFCQIVTHLKLNDKLLDCN